MPASNASTIATEMDLLANQVCSLQLAEQLVDEQRLTIQALIYGACAIEQNLRGAIAALNVAEMEGGGDLVQLRARVIALLEMQDALSAK